MNPRAFKVALMHVSQNQEVSPNEEIPVTEKQQNAKMTLTEKKKVINDSLDSYYSPVINAYLRQYDDIGQLMLAAQIVVDQFGESDVPGDSFEKRLGNIKVKILNAVGDTAMDEKYSLKQTFLNDSETNGMDEKELDAYIRSQLGKIKRDSVTKVKKVQGYLSA